MSFRFPDWYGVFDEISVEDLTNANTYAEIWTAANDTGELTTFLFGAIQTTEIIDN